MNYYLLALCSMQNGVLVFENEIIDGDPVAELMRIRGEMPNYDYTLVNVMPLTQAQYEQWNGKL